MKRVLLIYILFLIPFLVLLPSDAQEPKAKAKVFFESGEKWRRGKKDLDKAIAAYTEAIRLDPDFTEAYFQRGMCWADKPQRQLGKAIADFDETIKRDPKHREAYIRRGMASLDQKDYKNAIADFTHAIKIEPADPELSGLTELFSMRGFAWLGKKDYDKAIADFDRVISRDSRDTVTYYRRGTAWLGKKNYDKAFTDFNSAVRNDDRNPIYISYRGFARFYKKEYQQAIADFDLSEKLYPDGDWVYQHRAIMLATCSEPKYRDGKKAIEQAQKALKRAIWPESKKITNSALAEI